MTSASALVPRFKQGLHNSSRDQDHPTGFSVLLAIIGVCGCGCLGARSGEEDKGWRLDETKVKGGMRA